MNNSSHPDITYIIEEFSDMPCYPYILEDVEFLRAMKADRQYIIDKYSSFCWMPKSTQLLDNVSYTKCKKCGSNATIRNIQDRKSDEGESTYGVCKCGSVFKI